MLGRAADTTAFNRELRHYVVNSAGKFRSINTGMSGYAHPLCVVDTPPGAKQTALLLVTRGGR